MLSNSIIKSEELRDFLSVIAPEYSIPCLKTFIHTLLPQECQKVENIIRGILGLTDYCSITVDLWSNMQMRSYIGITCHLIDNNFQLHSFLLQCERFKGNHTAANISARVENVISTFNLKDKVEFIVTDNAANMVAAFNLPAFDNDLIGEDEFKLTVEEFEELSDYIYLTKHVRCFAHSLQLVIKHAFQKCQVPEFLKKVNKIVSFIRKSGKSAEYLEGETRAQAPNQTRWNSQLQMITSILKIDRTKLDSLPGLEVTDKLTNSDRAYLMEFEAIMKPFQQATNKIQGTFCLIFKLLHITLIHY